jgi:hypothetical protein
MRAFCMSTTGQLSMGRLLVLAVFVAFAIGDDPGNGAIGAAIVLAFLLLVLLGRRRNDTLDVVSGIGRRALQCSTPARSPSRARSCRSCCRSGGW